MEKLGINNISKNFFRTTTLKKVGTNHTNPFGVSFKGNVLTADVFQSASKTNLIQKVTNKSKMLSSAVVGSITNFGSAISTRLNSVVEFGNRIRQNTSALWQKARNIEINFDMANINKILNKKINLFDTGYSVANLQKRPVAELENMLIAELATI